MGLTRTEGWEARLSAVLEEARSRPYELGRHDCLRVALRAVEALTGVAIWPRFDGKYATRREALRLFSDRSRWEEFVGGPVDVAAAELAIKDHGLFTAAFCFIFEAETSNVRRARRGDICKYVDVEEHLGVCTGSHVAVLKADGLAFAGLLDCALCWRIG